MGLNDKLKVAASSTEVENILAEGIKYSTASNKTRRRWKSVATRRLKQLQGETETKAVVEHRAEVGEAKQEQPRNKYRQKREALAK